RFSGTVPSRADADCERLEHTLVAVVGWALARGRSSCVSVDVGVAAPPHGDTGEPMELSLVVAVEDTGPRLDADAGDLVPALAVARRLLDGVGGEAWVESSTSEATRVVFSFPVVRRKRVTATTLYGRGAVTDKTVLVVDDQGASRTALSELLASWHLLPTAVASASAALGALRGAAHGGDLFDVVLVDRHLGDDDGIALVHAIADQPELGAQRVILLDQLADLARPLPEDVRLAVAGRALKPILPEELIEVLTAVLAPPRTEPRLRPRPRVVVRGERALRILVAEDNPVNQVFMARLLEKRGHQVTVASNGADVIDCLDVAPDPYDVVLMDMQMPVLDGLETTGIIRERERRAGGPRLPIVAVTAHVMRGEEQRVLDAGLDAYVPKPVREERLFEAIARLVPGVDAPRPSTSTAPRVPITTVSRVPAAPPSSDGAAAIPIAEVPDVPPARIFDEAKLLSFVAGDTQFLGSLVELFIERAPQQLAAIGAAIASADLDALARSAHQLKGSVGNFGADRARHWASRLEQAGRDGSLAGAEQALAHLTGEVEALRVALRDLADRRVSG
ncbi:MAG: response regulator, partial [Deltaproteobacteria bacterium]